jgi:hypothetical protein
MSSIVIPVSSIDASILASKLRSAIDNARGDNAALTGDEQLLDASVRFEVGFKGTAGIIGILVDMSLISPNDTMSETSGNGRKDSAAGDIGECKEDVYESRSPKFSRKGPENINSPNSADCDWGNTNGSMEVILGEGGLRVLGTRVLPATP